MTHLPLHVADEGATKADIARLERRFDTQDERFDRLEDRFDRLSEHLDTRIDQMQRAFVIAMVSSMTALTAIFSLVVGRLG